jgi:hypothetical protein
MTTAINRLNINRSGIPEEGFKLSFLHLVVKRSSPPPPKSRTTQPQALEALPIADLLSDPERQRRIGTLFTELSKLFKAHK